MTMIIIIVISSHDSSLRVRNPRASVLLLWRVESDALPLHLVDDGFRALIALGGELSGPASQRLELLAQLDRLLDRGLLQTSHLRQGAAVVNSLAGLEHHKDEQRHNDEDDRQHQTVAHPVALLTRVHDYRPTGAGADPAAGVASRSGAPV